MRDAPGADRRLGWLVGALMGLLALSTIAAPQAPAAAPQVCDAR